MASLTPTPLPLPATEKDLVKALHSRRIQHRPNYLRDLATGHGESLLPLIEQLLATEPTVRSIPIPRPPQNESDLNADGGNPNPEFDVETLLFPQTNASSRYLQRDAGLTLATVLANKGSDRAIAILLTSLNHPHQVGRKRLVQCLAACAKDEDILAASQGSAPAVRDALVGALAKQKRKILINDILGKPHRMVSFSFSSITNNTSTSVHWLAQVSLTYFFGLPFLSVTSPSMQRSRPLLRHDFGKPSSRPRSLNARAFGTNTNGCLTSTISLSEACASLASR